MLALSLRRLLRATVVATGCAAVLLALAAVSATAAARVTPGSRYLALGDSWTFGYEEQSVVPVPDYRNAASFRGFPEHLGSRLRLKVANAACPGESSASLINPAAPNACSLGYRKVFPLHVHYRGSQLDYAVSYLRKHRRTQLVSLLIGGNDFAVCYATSSDGCASVSERAAVFTEVRRNVRRILRAIRGNARYLGKVAIVHYYPTPPPLLFVSGAVRALNRAMDRAARPFQVVVADSDGEFRRAASHSGANACDAGLLTQLDGQIGNCGIHPSDAGQRLLAQALEKAIKP